jgi:hypothetical protein
MTQQPLLLLLVVRLRLMQPWVAIMHTRMTAVMIMQVQGVTMTLLKQTVVMRSCGTSRGQWRALTRQRQLLVVALTCHLHLVCQALLLWACSSSSRRRRRKVLIMTACREMRLVSTHADNVLLCGVLQVAQVPFVSRVRSKPVKHAEASVRNVRLSREYPRHGAHANHIVTCALLFLPPQMMRTRVAMQALQPAGPLPRGAGRGRHTKGDAPSRGRAWLVSAAQHAAPGNLQATQQCLSVHTPAI